MVNKVCFVSTTSITMKCFIVPIAHELAKNGLDVTLICDNDDSMYSLCEMNGVRYHPIHMGRGIDFSGIKSIKEMKRFIKSENFMLVQYCTPNAAFYTSIAAKQAKVPIRLYCQWGIRYVGLSGISRKIFKILEKRVCSLSSDIRAVSWKNKDFAVSEGLYEDSKAQVVGNGGTIGVDLNVFDIMKRTEYSSNIREKYKIPQESFLFGFCGRLSRDKGGNELISAFKNMSENNTDIRLFVVGDIESNSGIDEGLFEWAKQSDKVIFTGKVAEEEVYKYYAPMNVLVHPTYREGFGMVIQEAAAYGIPCITTKIPGASEVMEDNESCLLVEVKNTKALLTSMERFINEKGLGKLLGEGAYQRTKQLYDRPVMMKYQVEDYLKLLKGDK